MQVTGMAPDSLMLVDSFIEEFCLKHDLHQKQFSSNRLERLCQLPWKGNIRELRNYIQRCVILAEGDTLDEVPLPSDVQSSPQAEDQNEFISLAELEQKHIKHVLNSVNGNQNKAAKILGISRTTLWRKLSE